MKALDIDRGRVGETLTVVARDLLGGASGKTAKGAIRDGRLRVDGKIERNAGRRLVAGERVTLDDRKPAAGPSKLSSGLTLLFEDRHLVVVDKPSGISSVPYDDREHGTLLHQLRAQLGVRYLGIVQRLDKETSGALVFTRSDIAEKKLRHSFRRREIDRTYLALAHGQVEAARIESLLLPNRGDGLRGSLGHFRPWRGKVPANAKKAVTHVEPVEDRSESTLVRCKLASGRQHQIRIHLAEAGHPLLGERVYVRDFEKAGNLLLPATRLMLHAATLGFEHPVTGRPMRFESPLPAEFVAG